MTTKDFCDFCDKEISLFDSSRFWDTSFRINERSLTLCKSCKDDLKEFLKSKRKLKK